MMISVFFRDSIRLFLFCHKPRWLMVVVNAMFIVFLLLFFINLTFAISINSNCFFQQEFYSSSSTVIRQLEFINQTSIRLQAAYAYPNSVSSTSGFRFGLIYQFSDTYDLVPFPIVFNCTEIIKSCQLQTIAGTVTITRDSEPIPTPLTPMNYTTSLTTQMGFFLRQGRYQLSQCVNNNGINVTDPSQIFTIEILYEKTLGTSCSINSSTCGSSSLTECSTTTSTCVCSASASPISYSQSQICADTWIGSNCTIFPTRCISWCNSTTNSLCICPSGTLRVVRNNFYVCELPVNAVNCSATDSIRLCSLGQCCQSGKCQDCSTTSTVRTTSNNTTADPTDQRLRIALGVIVGVLGTSVLVLIGVFCWLRYRQKRRRASAEKSLSPTDSSSKSSLYISPVEEQRVSTSSNTIYQLPDTPIDVDYQARMFSPIYRTDSFRRAIQSGQQRGNTMSEHVSSKRDSFAETSSYSHEELVGPMYSTLEYLVPSALRQNQRAISDADRRHPNIYHQVMIPPPSSSPTTVLTYAV